MPPSDDIILAVNGGSSSVKFTAYDARLTPLFSGQIERIGSPGTRLISGDETRDIQAADHAQAAHQLIDWLAARAGNRSIKAIGHRIVHGGVHLLSHQLITDAIV